MYPYKVPYLFGLPFFFLLFFFFSSSLSLSTGCSPIWGENVSLGRPNVVLSPNLVLRPCLAHPNNALLPFTFSYLPLNLITPFICISFSSFLYFDLKTSSLMTLGSSSGNLPLVLVRIPGFAYFIFFRKFLFRKNIHLLLLYPKQGIKLSWYNLGYYRSWVYLEWFGSMRIFFLMNYRDYLRRGL